MIQFINGRYKPYMVEFINTKDGIRFYLGEYRSRDEAENALAIANRVYKLTRPRRET